MKTYNLTQEQVNRLSNGESIKDVLPEAFTLEVGKWYKSTRSQALVFLNKKPEGRGIVGYGFDGCGNWTKNWFYETDYKLILATPQEVENALIAEAKKRGFKVGVYYDISDFGFPNQIRKEIGEHNKEEFIFFEEYNSLSFNGFPIFRNGKWATIVEKSKDEILNELIDYATLQDNTYLANNLKKLRDEN